MLEPPDTAHSIVVGRPGQQHTAEDGRFAERRHCRPAAVVAVAAAAADVVAGLMQSAANCWMK